MAYYYPQYYTPMTQQQTQLTQQMTQQPQSNNIIWISGEAAAKAYMIAPNSTVVLFDSESQTIYIKSADASGMPSIKTLDYTIREIPSQIHENAVQSDFATKADIITINEEIARIKEKLHESTVQHDRKKSDK